jgi:CBS domain-containing protein
MERRLGSVRVRDVMTSNPVAVPAHLDVEEFLHGYVMRSRYSAFPVVDVDGRVLGLITLRGLKRLLRERWPGTVVGTLACPLDDVPTARPDELLVAVLPRMSDDCSEGRLLVFDAGRLVGIVSPSDVQRAFELMQMLDRSQPSIPASV